MTWDVEPYYGASFSISKCRRYHAYMREFYRKAHEYSLAITAVSGSAAFVSLLGPDPNTFFARIASLVVALVTTADLICNFDKKADQHDVLCRRFTDLAARMVEWEATPAHLEAARAERLRIESDEPTERRLIEIRAHNDECRARGHGIGQNIPLGPLQRSVFSYIFTMFGQKGIEKRMEKKAKIAAVSN